MEILSKGETVSSEMSNPFCNRKIEAILVK